VVLAEKEFLNEASRAELVKVFAAFFVAHISLGANKRLRKAINDLKGQDEKQFERLVIEVATEVVPTWREKREGWKGRFFDPDDLMEIRTEITRTIEKRLTPPRAADLVDLAAFADKEKLLQRAKIAGLTPQEMQVFRLWIENPALKNQELGERLGISAGHVRVIKHRIKNSLGVA
jgi:DNA-binding CsgD family transcriptional regulator